MWHIKCGDFKVPDSERYFLEYRVMVFAYAFGDACAPQDARHNAVCAEEPYVLVASEDAVCIPHVVGMVVGEEDRFTIDILIPLAVSTLSTLSVFTPASMSIPPRRVPEVAAFRLDPEPIEM